MLRQRIKKSIKVVKELNAFPKIPEAYVETSSVGGTVTVLSWILIVFLIYMETNYWLDSRVHFKFEPDTDLEAKLTVNIDLTVAMICQFLTVDVVDPTNQEMSKFGVLKKEDVLWELSPEDRRLFNSAQYMYSYLKEESHSIQQILWKSGSSKTFNLKSGAGLKQPNADACRIYGSLTLNKVAGSIHILPGITMTLEVPDGHIHISGLLPDNEQNFSHRITHFSFGDPNSYLIQPLEGDEKVTDQRSHGMSGLFFKYDMSALKVRVVQERDSILQFFLRISSIICGVYVCTGVLNAVIRHICQLFSGKTSESQKKTEKKTLSQHFDVAPVPVIPQIPGLQNEKNAQLQ